MAKNTKFNCIEKWVKANPEYKIYEFPNDKDSRSYVVVWQTDIKKYWGFFEDGAHAYYNVSSLGKKPMKIGKWQCDGTDNFMFTSGIDVGGYPASPKSYYSKDKFVEKEIPQQPEQTTEPGTTDPENLFACIENYYADFESKLREDLKNKTKYEYFQDYMSITSPDGEFKENFFTDGKYEYFVNGKWFQVGNWRCKGERDYDVDESKPTQSEPTYDKSKFPLGLGSEGPEVAQLQNYLNKQIPMDPLVVNGIFNDQTHKKLIQLQKTQNLTK